MMTFYRISKMETNNEFSENAEKNIESEIVQLLWNQVNKILIKMNHSFPTCRSASLITPLIFVSFIFFIVPFALEADSIFSIVEFNSWHVVIPFKPAQRCTFNWWHAMPNWQPKDPTQWRCELMPYSQWAHLNVSLWG